MTPLPSESILFQVLVPSTERLDRFLADQLAMSRTQAARLLAGGWVLVNDRPARASQCLVQGDSVRVEIPATRAPLRALTPHPIELKVVFEDDLLLVIDKPAGLVVHPAPGHWEDTLVNALVARGTSLATGRVAEAAVPLSRAGEGTGVRPGIVHRIDKDTSGLIIVAKTDEAHRKLSHALGLRRIERQYAALVWGHIKAEQEIDAPIARNPRNRQQMAVVKTGRAARTLIQPVARFATCDLLRAKLFTGRTHQIRVHLAHIGHPIVGDPVYRGGGYRRMTGAQQQAAIAVERSAPRQALHAAVLRFAHPATRQWLEFRSDWPDDLRPALAAAAGDATLLARPNVLEYLGFRA
ncbi:MAG: RluA family pseudouridine synthase [Gemmatimonadetes bacterium]|nr:RluA family pseudouridine synthase [Gemmatimonadota bacterium]